MRLRVNCHGNLPPRRQTEILWPYEHRCGKAAEVPTLPEQDRVLPARQLLGGLEATANDAIPREIGENQGIDGAIRSGYVFLPLHPGITRGSSPLKPTIIAPEFGLSGCFWNWCKLS